jgi:SAM-dependent methyltransferase
MLQRALDRRPLIQQWEDRARRHGARAVLNLGHSEEEVGPVTEFQRGELYPILRAALRGDEGLVLDFGCGPGRFTADLREMIRGRAIGVDPIQSLLDLAPRHPGVDYQLMSEGRIPVASDGVDVIWICLVLGGIHGPTLKATASEIYRVLRPGGLLFLVENTSEGDGNSFWAFRSVAEYQALLSSIPLVRVHEYQDLGERISVMTGRKPFN